MAKLLNLKDYEKHLNSAFTVKVEEGEGPELTLTEATAGKSSDKYDSFSLIFTASTTSRFMPQKIYELEHKKLGTVSMFLVPVHGDDEKYEYQAVFSREKKKAG